MLRRDLWLEYLEMLAGRVMYAEDNSYRIMMYRGEKFSYIPKSFLLYEYGTGISTGESQAWKERLRKDWQVTDQIMLSLEPCSEVKRLRVPEFLQLLSQKDFLSRWQRWKIYPARVYYRIKSKFFPRWTPTNIDEVFVTELLGDQ